jgi:sulfane dehydrogenase subunit SoxC
VLVALFQNGEPIRPEQGYPMRLFVPGWEGNISVKWLAQLKLMRNPAQFRDETSKYTDVLPDRTARQFTFPMETKSLITSPSGEMTLPGAGLYKITGLAWSGSGSIRGVEVSADGGRTWADALIESEKWDKALCRFSIPWEWNGGDAILQSRATDSQGNVQLTREAVVADRGTGAFYHNPGIQSWTVSSNGEVSHTGA